MSAIESLALRPATRPSQPVVIGHRGAPAYRPEPTAASYELAIDLGAELIEPDVVISGDGVLVVRHESELSLSTDVATRAEFSGRRTTKFAGEQLCTGWFAEDFTLAELRTLRAIEPMPGLRPLNTAYDGQFGILTLAEVVQLARRRSTPERTIRVLAELKHVPSRVTRGLSMAELVTQELQQLGATDAHGPVLLQSFDADLLRDLRSRLGDAGPKMVQLIGDHTAGDQMVTSVGLREISAYAQGVAPSRDRLVCAERCAVQRDAAEMVYRSHVAGLTVYSWPVCPENASPALGLQGSFADIRGAESSARLVLDLGVDGVITDIPDVAVRVRDERDASLVA